MTQSGSRALHIVVMHKDIVVMHKEQSWRRRGWNQMPLGALRRYAPIATAITIYPSAVAIKPTK
jgi:hypothetical protein